MTARSPRHTPPAPKRAPLSPQRIVIGTRQADIDLSHDPLVSSRHAVVQRDSNGRVTVEDLGSLNGTWLNNARVYAPTRLYPGDQLRIGHQTVQIPAELFTAP